MCVLEVIRCQSGEATGARLGIPTDASRVVLTVDSETVLDRPLRRAIRQDLRASFYGAREQLNEAIFQRIIVVNKHISQHELAEPFRSMLGGRFQNPRLGGGQRTILKKSPCGNCGPQ